ncbi:hypothetical protein LPJ73_000830, partial [Coemansia sp. RSA 2703]
MKFFAAVALSVATAVVAQNSSSSSTTLSAYEKCLEDKCSSNKNDVNCQAACLGNPNPNASMIAATNECYKKCDGLGHQEAIDCKTNCDNLYNPSGSIVTDHLTPDGVTAQTSTSSSSSAEATSTNSDSSDSSNSNDTKSASHSSTDKGSKSDNESSNDENSNDSDVDSSSSSAST